MLEARDLACLRGEHVVFAGLSFLLAPGEALLLTGANGAGKSTLLRVMAGLLRPAEGALLWEGRDALADRAAHAARLRYLGHGDAVKPALTARENLAFYARLWGGAVGPALEALGLAPLAELPARVLSAGQRRRLALARLALGMPSAGSPPDASAGSPPDASAGAPPDASAGTLPDASAGSPPDASAGSPPDAPAGILPDAPLWLLDEPTTGLDAASVALLGGLLARHRACGGMVAAATHLPLPLPGARELRL